MQAISRFQWEGRNCYVLEDGGLRLISTERGLYEEGTLRSLTDSGYKVYDYHGDIRTAEGISIKELVELPNTESENALQQMLYLEEEVLTEAEATQYFTRDLDVAEVPLLEPKVTINTREELVAYLRQLQELGTIMNLDVRPLNSFVSRDALFTIEELADDKVRELYGIVVKRRVFRSLSEYQELIKFLQEEAGLGENYTRKDVVQAYLSWGVCGIKTPIVDIHMKSVCSLIDEPNDEVAMSIKDRCRRWEPAIMDKAGVVYTSHASVNWNEVADVNEAKIQPENNRVIQEYDRAMKQWVPGGQKYKILQTLELAYTDRVYVDFMSSEGKRATGKFDPDHFCIFSSNGNLLLSGTFFGIRALDGREIPIQLADTKEKMMAYSMSYSKVLDMVKKVTVKTPVKSTVEMLRQEGLTDETAAMYIAKRLVVDNDLNGEIALDCNFMQASRYYREGPSQDLIKLFNPNDLAYSNLSELLQIMLETRDGMIERGEYPLDPESMNAGIKDFIYQRTPLECLEFVQKVRQGDFTIGNMNAGKRLDESVNRQNILKVVVLVVQRELAGRENICANDVNHILQQIEDGSLIDLSSLLRQRDAEFRGYLKDLAQLRSLRAVNSCSLIWITKVFREISNMEPGEQRHYMFECLEYPISEKNVKEVQMQKTLNEAFIKAVKGLAELPSVFQEFMEDCAPEFGAKLIFKLITGKANLAYKGDDVLITERLDIPGRDSIDLVIKVEKEKIAELLDDTYLGGSHIKYCTLYDWCTYEMDMKGNFRYYCLNATITPWYVIPRPGYSFKSYNMLLNYYKREALQSLPKEFLERVQEEKAKPRTLCDTWHSHSFIEDKFEDLVAEHDINTIDCLLMESENETVEQYYTRWSLWNKAAKADPGKVLYRIPLKSDIGYANFATEDDKIGDSEKEYGEESDPRVGSYCLSKIDVLDLSDRRSGNRVLLETNKVYALDLDNVRYEELSGWAALLDGSYTPAGFCMKFGGMLMVTVGGEKKSYNLFTITKKELEELAEWRIAYKLNANRYMFLASNYFVVEVI